MPARLTTLLRNPLAASRLIVATLTCIVLPSTAAMAQTPPGFLGPQGILTRQEVNDGWIALFDGQTLYGWRPQKQANFRVEDGAIVVDQGEQCLLCTTTQFADYVLRLEFRAPAATNSGIFLRTSPRPGNVTRDCFELNIAPQDNPFPTGSLVKRQKVTGKGTAADSGAAPVWHQYEVTMQGTQVTVKLNGDTILEYSDPNAARRGFIGLQHNSGEVAFRNIKLKPLQLSSIFDGKSLSGWKQYPDMASRFLVTPEGWMKVFDGRGMLESNGSYGDFVLQLQCITHGVSLNSGIFFRCIPGEQMNGYESQIQNGVKDGSRDKPADCGTGGIFRRRDARYVAANDFEWFSKTIIAEGPHIATWVNGYQVNDWVDRRKPNANPRRGLRTEPGTFMIQGHDPTTEISFRRLMAAETPARWSSK